MITYIFIKCTDSQFLQWIEVLQRSRGEPNYQIQVLHASSHGVEVMADWNGGGFVHSLIKWVFEIRYLK